MLFRSNIFIVSTFLLVMIVLLTADFSERSMTEQRIFLQLKDHANALPPEQLNSLIPDQLPVAGNVVQFSLESTAERHDDVGRLIKEAQSSGYQESFVKFTDYVSYASATFLSGTRFSGRITINSQPKPGHVNIYFVADNRHSLVRNFHDNCAYIGYFDAIICDVSLFTKRFAAIDKIQTFFDIVLYGLTGDNQVELLTPESTPNFTEIAQGTRVPERLKASLLLWVLGHEIGHAVLHAPHIQRREQFHFSAWYDGREKEADAYVVRKLATNPNLAFSAKTALSELIQHEYREYLLTSVRNSNNLNVPELKASRAWTSPLLLTSNNVSLFVSRYNVPVLLRELRLASSLAGLDRGSDPRGYFSAVLGRITIVEDNLWDDNMMWLFVGTLFVAALLILYVNLPVKIRERR